MSDKLQQSKELYLFGAFRLDATERRLWRETEPIQLTPKQFDLLFYFVENAGRVAKKSELLDAVWADAFVEETTLARNISWLRKILGESFIETVPKLGYRFTAEVTRPAENLLIIEEQTVQYTRAEEIITFDNKAAEAIFNQTSEPKTVAIPPKTSSFRQSFTTPIIVIMALAVGILAGVGFVNFNTQTKPDLSNDDLNKKSNFPIENISKKELNPVKIGSVVHLKSGVSDDAGYLDVWGEIKNKPEFRNLPTEIKFVSTHPNPNRENNSGSWRIVSSTGKKDGETLVYGDKIHLQSMFPDGGFLDNCGRIVDMGIFKAFVNYEKFAVFTTADKNRDRGTGTWTIGSNAEYHGSPVLEGHSITLENGFPGGGYLNAQGFVIDIPAYNDYDGTHLVFIRASTPNPRPPAGNWIISNSNVIR